MDLLYKNGVTESDYSRTDLVKAAENGHWWTKRHFQLWVKGYAPHKDKKMETIIGRINKA